MPAYAPGRAGLWLPAASRWDPEPPPARGRGPADPTDYADRLDDLRAALADGRLDVRMLSRLERLALLPTAERAALVDALSEADAAALLYDWTFVGRPSQQIPPGNWYAWLVLTGRGWGKTRTGAETVRDWSADNDRLAIVAADAGDARDVMVEGESGILAVSPPDDRPVYEPSKRRLTWRNGATATLFSGEDPEALRGPQHKKAWIDELAKMRYARAVWDMLRLGLRLGRRPQVIVTTTPKPKEVLLAIVNDRRTVVTRGSLDENAHNLAPAFRDEVRAMYGGTRTGRQEIGGELLMDVPGALWQRAWIDAGRRTAAPDLRRVVVAVDPAVSAGEGAADTGIVVAGVGTERPDPHFYTLADRTVHATPDVWARAVLNAYTEFRADAIVAEVNNGGDLVARVIRVSPGGATVRIRVVHASRGKVVRAEPMALFAEQGRDHHVGAFPVLEDQMCAFTQELVDAAGRGVAGARVDRVDAKVWALTDLSSARGWSAA